MANLAAAFEALPKKIRDWLGSDEVTDLIADISDSKGSVIAKAVLRLTVGDLNPRDFINELSSQLSVDYEKAKEISQQILDNVLKPIEISLKEAGVDVGLMIEYPRKIAASATAPPRNDDRSSVIASPDRNRGEAISPPDNLPIPKSPVKPVSPDKPFILYQEEDVSQSPSEKPSFKYRPPLEDRVSFKLAPKAEIGIPGQIARVVHYSEFITPLNQAVIQKPEIKPRIIPIPKSRWFI